MTSTREMISWLLAPGSGPCGLRGLLLAAGPLGDKGINRSATRQVESTGADPWLCSARLIVRTTQPILCMAHGPSPIVCWSGVVVVEVPPTSS